MTNAGFTIQFWFQPSAGGTFSYTFGDAAWVGAAGAFRCFMNGAAGGGNFLLRGPLTQLGTIGSPLTAMTGFNHYAVVVDGSNNTITWYVNGAMNNTGVANITGMGTNFTCMGYNGSSAAGSEGNYDDYRVYNWARSGADVMQDYTDGLAGLGVFGQAPLSPSTCFTQPDEVYLECDVPQNAHNASITRNTEPGSPHTRLFTAGDVIAWDVTSPSPGPFAGSALINVFFGNMSPVRTEGFNDPTPAPGGPYNTTLGATNYSGIQLGSCLSTPAAMGLPILWPDSLGLAALGVAPCGGFGSGAGYAYGAGLTPASPNFPVPFGIFTTGDRIDIQWFAPDPTFFQAGSMGTSNRCVFEYVDATAGPHAHIEARGVSSLQVTGFWEIHNTGDVPIMQVSLDASTAATPSMWNPTGALNSGGTLATLTTFRRGTDLVCDLVNPPGYTLDGVPTNMGTGNVLTFDFMCPPAAGGGFEGPTDHFIFDCDFVASIGGAAAIGTTVTITYCDMTVQTGQLVADPADPAAAVLDT